MNPIRQYKLQLRDQVIQKSKTVFKMASKMAANIFKQLYVVYFAPLSSKLGVYHQVLVAYESIQTLKIAIKEPDISKIQK
jgi:hypothetical protein